MISLSQYRRPFLGELRILIVDDEQMTRTFIKGCLQMSFPGCIIVEAASGQSALEKMIFGESFHIVLCD